MEFSTTYDVVIAGAGVAGVAAALECARAGMRTALLEKTVLVGGLATTGLVNIYLPLCDGRGHQVIKGISEELLHLSMRYGPGEVPAWREGHGRYQVVFSPASFILALDEELVKAGVHLWLDTLVCNPVLRGERLVGLEVENKSGRGLLNAQCVIDATGDADVAYRAGAPCVEGGNWLSMWALQASIERAGRAAQDSHVSLLDPVRVGGSASGEGHPDGMPRFGGVDGRSVTQFVLEGRRLLREHYQAQHARGGDTDRSHCFPYTLPAMAQFRTTRRIDGRATIADAKEGIFDPSSVGVSPDWRQAGPVWEIPYGALLPQSVSGLLVAGRCMSAETDAWEVMRVIPPAALTGQVAGIAATLACQRSTTPDLLPILDVQNAIRAKGLPLHRQDVLETD